MSGERKTEADPAAEIELRPDGWERFERAVDAAVRTPASRLRRAPPERQSVCLNLDASEVICALDELSSEIPKRSLEFVEGFFHLSDLSTVLVRFRD